MTNSTTRRRGRHAAPTRTVAPPPPRPAMRRPAGPLPAMEVLGFYDEPYQVQVVKPRLPATAAKRLAHTSPHAVHSARVASLWETTEVDEALFERWAPAVISRRRLGGRRFRMSTLVAVSVAVALVAASAFVLAQRPAQRATEALARVSGEATALGGALPAVVEVVESLAASSGPELGAATAATLAAETAARALFTSAGDLPEELSYLRAPAVDASSAVLDATSRFNRLLAYRIAVERALVSPSLATGDLAAATAAVAEWRVVIEEVQRDLPAELPHRRRVDAWVASLESWQHAYLDAVREGDEELAARLSAQVAADITALKMSLREELTDEQEAILDQLGNAQEKLAQLIGG